MFAVTILGNNSALPMHDRHPTSQVLTMDDQTFLIDCGEGTQVQMNRFKIRRSRINNIFISHLHGDHYFGLFGLLNSLSLISRTEDLHLYAPPQLEPILKEVFRVADTNLSYRLFFHPLQEEGQIWEGAKATVSAFRVFHRIDCWGFLFR
jgi:ribonuclease Z